MDADEYRRMAEAGHRHWWYAATRELLEQLAAAHLPPIEASTRYLDAAGGSGATGTWLVDRAPTLVDDVDEASIRFAHDHGGYTPVLADLNALPHPDRSFDAVLCVTALCHRMNPDPQRTVDELVRVAKPGGLICLMEPGVRRLRRGHDRVTHTARRFSRRDLAAMLRHGGADVVRATGAYTFLVPPAVVLAILERGRTTSDVGRNESGLGGVFGALARAERAMLVRTNLPTGLSAIAIGRRPA